MPGLDAGPAELYGQAVPLLQTPGHGYVERRGIPVAVAERCGLRFDPDFGGRAAVVMALRDLQAAVVSVHGRYLDVHRGQNKMLTVGPGGGLLSVLDGHRAEPLILVEGLFDALSLATCGWSAVATIGRWTPLLQECARGRHVCIAFDRSAPGRADAGIYASRLAQSRITMLSPPLRCKDWSTALVKLGRGAVTRWMHEHLGERSSDR